MPSKVRIPTQLRSLTNGLAAVEVGGTTVKEVLRQLDVRYPGIGERLQDGDAVRRFINIYVNEEDIRFSGGLETEIPDGAIVSIIPSVAGGQ